MQQLKDEGIQKDITDIWSKLGEEGEGEELKLAAHHCLLGVQDTLCHPQDYAVLINKLSAKYANHPRHHDFDAFKHEIETGEYQVHFLLDKVRHEDGSRSIYMVTYVERVDRQPMSPTLRTMIETWASIIGYDALKMDIESVLKQLQHVPSLSPQLFKATES